MLKLFYDFFFNQINKYNFHRKIFIISYKILIILNNKNIKIYTSIQKQINEQYI